METRLWIALVAGISAVVVALISFVGMILTHRRQSQSAESVELMRNSLESDRLTQGFRDSEFASSLEGLRDSLSAIQGMKEQLQLLLSAVAGSLESTVAIERVANARECVSRCYEEYHPRLNAEESDALHIAKIKCLKAYEVISQELSDKNDASDLTQNGRRRLLEIRRRLTECQIVLLNRRVSRLETRFLRT